MNTTLTNPESTFESGSNAFVPMSEEQMTVTKGGTDLPDWLQDLIDTVADLLAQLEGVFEDPDSIDDDVWDDLRDDLEADGILDTDVSEYAADW